MPEMLWAKGEGVDALIHRFTVGEDPTTDLVLLPFDCLASAAHARALAAAGLLPDNEASVLAAELGKLHRMAEAGELSIPEGLEDGHTLLEAKLTEVLGEVGAKIHLGRSRNEQVALALRLWMRNAVLDLGEGVLHLAEALLDFAAKHGDAPLPGFTHLRAAMPSSFGLWAEAFAEALLEELEALQALDTRLDRSPAHSAAGFGTPLPLDPALTAQRLGFSRVQRNPLDAQNARGRHEGAVMAWLSSLSLTIEKLAWDGCLYGAEGFGFLNLPSAFTTGSSLMPQKRNPDALELARGRAREIRGLASTVERIAGGLPSSYHRDFQLLKKPLIEAVRHALQTLAVITHLIEGLEPDLEAAHAACTDELYAANEAFRLSPKMPFRRAYRAVSDQLADGSFSPDRDAAGAPPSAPLVSAARVDLTRNQGWLDARRRVAASITTSIFPPKS
ncbi:MAG: argininosuccinate lyase [Acidobacteria bacterium]|nr:argininosuccinate lyase [Acidobacteriota bacterium]